MEKKTMYFILPFCFFATMATSLNREGEVLLSLLSATSPSSSLILSSWNTSTSTPCSWRGVQCSADNKITSLSLPNTFLNLSSLPQNISSLSSLRFLNLSSTNISGIIPKSLSLLTHLRSIDLSSNDLFGPIPPDLANLSSLRILCLQDNLLSGTIPSELGYLVSLRELRIGGNSHINGEIPPQLGSLGNLTILGLAATGISGEIPNQLGNLTNLRTLALYDTEISGFIPGEIGYCSELRNLYLHMNKLGGLIPPQIGKLRNLKSLLLWGNSITGRIPPPISNCSSLQILDLSANHMSGEILVDLGKLLVLEQLHLSDNFITREIPSSLRNCTKLSTLQLDTNHLSGSIPWEIGNLKKLQSLFLWGNSIAGAIPSSLGNCSELRALDLSNNLLTGSIPGEIFKLKKLSKLLLLGNSLSGGLTGISKCESLERLRLGENHFSCEIPKELGQLQNLVFLDLYMNHFTGNLPSEIADIVVLQLLDAHSNRLTGEIPSQLGQLLNLEQLDLSWNIFFGEIPHSLGSFTSLNKLILANNLLTGSIPKTIRNLQKLTLLDLSSNNLSGEIQPEIGYLTTITINLDLSFNEFRGELPETMSGLTQLQSLNLAGNILSGNIKVLSLLVSLTVLNISYNNFSGPIPSTPFFKTLATNSFLENPYLCESLDGTTCLLSQSGGKNGSKSSKTATLASIILASVSMAVIGSWIFIAKNRNHTRSKFRGHDDLSHPWSFIRFQKLSFTVDNILDCLKEQNVIGKGCSGIVYKAEMPNGELIAVKQLFKSSNEDDKEDAAPPVDFFASETQILGHIRHRNIVKLLGYCSNKSVKLLLYNYISNGNLQQLLRGNNGSLDWKTRYKITLGSAQGLAYLHHDCVPAILHRDVKSNNILLDSNFEAYIADFGLAKLMKPPTFNHAMSRVAGSFGYIAPEYGYTMDITEKSDVYSYGVVLLEIISGRSAIGSRDGLHIVEWARKTVGNSIFDAVLQEMPDQMMQEMLQTLGIAMLCVNSLPSERPTMKEVVELLIEVKSAAEEGRKNMSQSC